MRGQGRPARCVGWPLAASCLPERVVDVPYVRYGYGDPLGPRIGPRHALLGVGILDVALPVPHAPPDVQLVVQDAGATARMPVNGARAPSGTPRPRIVSALKVFAIAFGEVPETNAVKIRRTIPASAGLISSSPR